MFRNDRSILTVILVLALFGWPQIARITRGSVMSVKNEDYVTASRALGSGRMAMLLRHVMPNAAAPIIVTATVELGVFIVSEATLSFLGIGLPSSVVSWGADIAAAKDALNSHPSVLLFPAGALALTVLGFIHARRRRPRRPGPEGPQVTPSNASTATASGASDQDLRPRGLLEGRERPPPGDP